MKTIQITIGNDTKIFTSSLAAVSFIASNPIELPKPVKKTKKYSVWNSVDEWAKSQGL